MRKVIILSGISGSGKSTYIASRPAVVVSADHYFTGVDGAYNFDPTKLGEAHGACFREFIELVRLGSTDVVVDNTNTSVAEVAPYVLAAQAYGWDVEILTLMCESEDDVRECAGRNTHGVPFQVVMVQHRQLQERILPPWWKVSYMRPSF
jgi:predicted kinase